MLNPSIILRGETPNFLGNMAGGVQAAQQMRQAQTQNRLADLYQTQGAGIANGDQNALNALAGIDPMAAMGVQSNRLGMDQTRLGMDSTRQTMGIQAENAKRAAAEYAKGLSNEQRMAEAAQLEKGLSGAAFFYSQGDRAGYDRFLQEQGIDPAQVPFDAFPAQAAMFGGVLDVLKGFQPEKPEFGVSDGQFYDKNNPGAGAQPIPGMVQTGSSDPSAVAELKFRAQASGLIPGTPEYQSFMLNGGGDATNFRALDQQAQASGFVTGTPEYQQFMASRGAGYVAGAARTEQNNAQANTGRAAAYAGTAGDLDAKRDLGGEAARVQAAGAAQGKADAESAGELREMQRNMPGLITVVAQLDALADTATYTAVGIATDEARKQLGQPPTPGAIARAEYTAIIDNQVLPLLRSTFGAAFTEKEGARLAATLGDPDKSPSEKKAVMRAFIAQKTRDIESRGGVVNNPAPVNPGQPGAVITFDANGNMIP